MPPTHLSRDRTAGTPPQTFRECVDRHGIDFLRNTALQALDGATPAFLSTSSVDHRVAFQHAFLAFALSDESGARRDWAALTSSTGKNTLPDRDGFVEALWRAIETDDGYEDLRDLVFSRWKARDAYRTLLFNWFLRRFHPAAALRIYTTRASAGQLYGCLFAISILVLVAALLLGFAGTASILSGLIGAAAFPAAVRLLSGRTGAQLAQLLFPRLVAGIAIGYLFLAAAPQLITVASKQESWGALCTTSLLVIATLGYAMFHVARRVHPPLRWKALARRALPVVSLAFSYAFLGLALFGPLFGSAALYGSKSAPDLNWSHWILIASIALALGMILELAWEEKPLTEPM